jgi:hypothetical protein
MELFASMTPARLAPVISAAHMAPQSCSNQITRANREFVMQVRTTILRIIFILLSIASLAYVANLKAQPHAVVNSEQRP